MPMKNSKSRPSAEKRRMRNRLLAIVRDSIPYIKELRPHVGSVTSAILMQQLDYWFERYPDGFYKFLEPSDHKAYQPGDSWTEELGFSKAEFRSAFDHIGIRYESKRAFDQKDEQRRFIDENGQEQFYASYKDRIKGLTFYYRNHAAVDTLLDKICADVGTPVSQESESTEVNNVDLRKSRVSTYVSQESESPINRTEIITEITTDTTLSADAGARAGKPLSFKKSPKPNPEAKPHSNSSHPMVVLYRDVTKHHKLNLTQINLIAEQITDESAWKTVITAREGRGLPAVNVVRALKEYERLTNGETVDEIYSQTRATKEHTNGSNQKNSTNGTRYESRTERSERFAAESLRTVIGGAGFNDPERCEAEPRETDGGGPIIDLESPRRLSAGFD
jgi:hypothetical protein